jgi:hypothetical protein
MTARKIVRLTTFFVLLLGGAPMLSGCSVGMAVAGKETPNLAACRVGATQADIQAELGRPTSSRVLENGDNVCTYAYEVGNDPSAGRAVLHGGMDVLTFGLWELVGTPAEAMQGQKYEMTVTYDAEGNAKAIETRPVKSEP